MANAWIEETLPQVASTLTTQRFKSQFSALTNNADRVQFCLAQKEVQRWLGLFVSKFLPNQTGLKCATTAAEYREKGNDRFRGKNFESAIQLYSRAICFAPQTVDSTASELALAFGNRSAAYFQLGQHENALKDVNVALDLGYGRFKSATKLQLRKCDCLIRLGRASEAKEFLNFMQQPTGDESDTKRWIELFGRISLDDKKNDSNPKAGNVSLIEKLTNKGLFKSNEKMPSFSTKVAVQYDEVKGRHLVAQVDIEFGDILAVSPPYSAILDAKDGMLLCQHCYREISHLASSDIRPIPCTGCSSVLFCSEECRTESANSYHRYECGQHDLLVHLSGSLRMSLRMLYRAGVDQIRSVVDSPVNASHFSEQAEGHYSHVYQLVHHTDGPLEGLNISYQEMLKSSILACLLLQLAKNSNFPMGRKEEETLIGGILLRQLHQIFFNNFLYPPLDKKKEAEVRPPQVLLDLYPTYASVLNHSCKANARLESAKSQSVSYVQAARSISAGTEITIPYWKEVYRDCQYVWNTRKTLWTRYRFHCNCAECAYLIRNMPFGISKQYPYYRLSCSKCSNLMERASEISSESEVFRCTACPLEMTNAEVKRRYSQIDELARSYIQMLPEISKPMMTDDNYTWRFFKSIIDKLDRLLHLESTGQLYMASYYFNVGQFDKWWACCERFFSTIEFLYGTESVKFVELINKLRNIHLEETTFTEHHMKCFKRQNKELYEHFLARLEQWKQLKRKYNPEY